MFRGANLAVARKNLRRVQCLLPLLHRGVAPGQINSPGGVLASHASHILRTQCSFCQQQPRFRSVRAHKNKFAALQRLRQVGNR